MGKLIYEDLADELMALRTEIASLRASLAEKEGKLCRAREERSELFKLSKDLCVPLKEVFIANESVSAEWYPIVATMNALAGTIAFQEAHPELTAITSPCQHEEELKMMRSYISLVEVCGSPLMKYENWCKDIKLRRALPSTKEKEG
jgi:hypothetical protein